MNKKIWLVAAAAFSITTAIYTPCRAGAGNPKHGLRTFDADRASARRIENLEAILGKPLTDDQKTAIKQAIETHHTAQEQAGTQEEQSIATALNTNVADMDSKLKAAHKKGEARPKNATDYATHLQGALGITLTDAQKVAVTQAYDIEQAAVKTANKEMANDEAKALGLTPSELKLKEKEYRQTHPGTGGHRK